MSSNTDAAVPMLADESNNEERHSTPTQDDDSASSKPITGSCSPSRVSESKPQLAQRSREPFKSVLTSSSWEIAYLTHALALAMTIAVVQLSFRNVYFADVGADGVLGLMGVNEALKALQFAAKLHEITLGASIGGIIFHLTYSYMLGAKGIPLGLVSAPYSIGSAGYMISQDFLANVAGSHLLFALAVLFFTLLMMALGPASAMALVPSLDWWNVSDPYHGRELPVWVGSHAADLWPLTVTPELTTCIDLGNYTLNCPNAGFPDIKMWASTYTRVGRRPEFTFTEGVSGARRRILSRSEDDSDEALLSYIQGIPTDPSEKEKEFLEGYLTAVGPTVLTTTPSHSLALLLGGVWAYANRTNLGLINQAARARLQVQGAIPTYEPLVAVRCFPWDYATRRHKPKNSSIEAPFTRTGLGQTGITTMDGDVGWSVPESVWNYSRPMDAVSFSWFEREERNINASIGGMFTIPYVTYGEHVQKSVNMACTVEAHWVASHLTYDPSSSDILSDNVSDPMDFAYGRYPAISGPELVSKFGISPVINISLEWANQLNLPISPTDNKSAIATLLEPFVLPVNGNSSLSLFVTEAKDLSGKQKSRVALRQITNLLATILGLVVCDGLSRVHYRQRDLDLIYHQNATHFSRTSLIHQWGSPALVYNATNTFSFSNRTATNGTIYPFDIQRWGYGYGLRTHAARFGVTMLLLHGCLVLGYMIWFAFVKLSGKRTEWALTTRRWSTISELLALAINSPSSKELDGTCAGISERESRRLTVRIRDVGDRHLALVVGTDQEGYSAVQRGYKYGSTTRGEF